MRQISVGQALAAGLDLVRREPLVFVAWCGLYFLISGLPAIAFTNAAIPMFRELSAAKGSTISPAVLAMQAQLAPLQTLSFLGSFAVLAVFPAAVFRAVLQPEERGFLYLRVGAREGWVLLVTLVLFAGWMMGMVVTMIPMSIVGFVGAAIAIVVSKGGSPAGTVVLMILMITLFIAFSGAALWALLRYSMAPVMAYADKTFRLMESWDLTRGHAWRMFLVALAITGITLLTELIVVGVAIIALVGNGDLSSLAAQFQSDPASLFTPDRMPWFALATFVLSLLGAGYYIIWCAAWADIYRQLRPPLAETFD